MIKTKTVFAFAVLMASAALANAEVRVDLLAPERFLDLKMPDMSIASGQEQFIRSMEQELAALIEKTFDRDKSLHVVFEQVDLAGHIEPMRGRQAREIRVVKTMDPLRLKFSYSLSDLNGNVSEQGSEDIKIFISQADMYGKGKNRELFFERRMMREWFLGEFGEKRQ
jgi:hypothetical protein